MIEIRYGDYYVVADMAGQSVSEARGQFKAEFGITDKASAKLNGKKVKGKLESEIRLNDDDKLSFAEARGKGVFLVAVLLMAFAVTGGVFAYGYVTASVTLGVSVPAGAGDFVDVTANNTVPIGWTPYGDFMGSTGNGTLWDIDTASSDYTGDMVATIYITNADSLVEVYRVLAMVITVYDSSGNIVDINGDGSANVSTDYALLTLDNGSVDLNIAGAADVFTIKLDSGFYSTHIYGTGWTSGSEAPALYIDVANR